MFKMCLILMIKLDEPFINQETFIISLFSIVEIWVEGKFFFWSIFCHLDPDLWICIFFVDLDPGSKNLPDLTDPDPKHCNFISILSITFMSAL